MPGNDSAKTRGFKITKELLDTLRKQGIPEKILGVLQQLEQQDFSHTDELFNGLEEHIGAENTAKYTTQINLAIQEDAIVGNLIAGDNNQFMSNIDAKGSVVQARNSVVHIGNKTVIQNIFQQRHPPW